jgi:hypothetical protein
MILDLEKIAKLERKYQNDRIALDALQTMVSLVSMSSLSVAELVNTVQFMTLCDLGVIKGVSTGVQQLNS